MPARSALAFFLVLGGCSAPRAAPPPDEGTAQLVLGDRYDKSSYVTPEGAAVLAFRREITNLGTAPGRAASPACSVEIDNRRVPLVIFENPVLDPGETGWLRAGAEIAVSSHREFDDLEAHCDV